MSALQRPLTYDDLLEMPDDGMRREIMRGELIVTPATTAGHQRVVSNLHLLLRAYARKAGGEVNLAPFDVILSRFDIVQPDLLYLSQRHARIPDDEHAFQGAPDLVVAVISRGTGWIDRARKMALYATSGIPESWIADPMRRQIVVYALTGQEYAAVEPDSDGRISSPVWPGLRIDPAEVFAGLD